MAERIAIIVAAAENGVIGRDGRLAWRIPSDLKTFRRLTLGKPVIMGRKTFQSLNKPLDGRDNIVVTRDPAFRPEGVVVAPSLEAALEAGRRLARARGVDEVMVIGGGEIYRAAMRFADRIYLSRVHAAPAGDTWIDTPSPLEWAEVQREAAPADSQDDFAVTLLIFDRKANISQVPA